MNDVLIPSNGTLSPAKSEQPPLTKPKAVAQHEYVAGGSNAFLYAYFQSLPQWIDDISRDFGADIYERMLLDDQVSSDINTIKTAVLAEGFHIDPAISDKQQEGYDLAVGYAKFIEHCLDNLSPSFDLFMAEMLDSLALGHKLAEQTYQLATYNGQLLLTLESLKTKPRQNYAFVVDQFMNVSCLLARLSNQSWGLQMQTALPSLDGVPNAIPREKFALMTFNPANGDPRGRPLLRPAYTPWSFKLQIWGEWLKFLSQQASPKTVGETSPNSQNRTDDATGAIFTPEQEMLTALRDLHNGSAVAIPPGAKVTILESSGDGSAFYNAMDACDRRITKAIQGQTLATNEGKHQSRAASEVQFNVMGFGVQSAKNQLRAMAENDIFYRLMEYNFGTAVAKRFTPKLVIGKKELIDFDTMSVAAARLAQTGYLASDQYPAMDERLGLPIRKSKSISELPKPAPTFGGQGMQAGFALELSKAKIDRIAAADIDRSKLFLASLYGRKTGLGCESRSRRVHRRTGQKGEKE